MESLPVPTVRRVLQQTWAVSRQAWVALLYISVIAWAPFALSAGAWALLTVSPEGLAGWLRAPTGGAEVITRPSLFLLGIPLVLGAYVVGVSWAAGASAIVADGVLRGAPPTAVGALGGAFVQLHRTVGVYLALSGLAALGACAAVSLAGAVAWVTASLGTVASLALTGAALLCASLCVAALWLLAYSRWSLALPASVLSKKGPLRGSAALTRGRRISVLVRVAAIALAVLLASSVAGVTLTLLQLGPGQVIVVALAFRVLLSVVSGAVSTAGTTPLYRALSPDA